ncbi:MAG: thiamine-phosphate kinase [Opitutaceae bacterium]|jgi:thiamine-monophosphate kinase
MHPFTSDAAKSVSSLGEERLIAAIRRWLGSATPRAPFGIGDDCAVVPQGRAAQLLTVDPVIYGEHYDDSVPPKFAGEKLLKRNLSDIAAMGGRPRAAVIAFALDSRVRIDWLKAFYQGLAAASRRYGVPIVGGDVARHQGGIVATLTLVGEASGPRTLTRTGARAGDWIYVTGQLGGSLASSHHYLFTPRLKEGAWLSRRGEVRAMMDVSDGLAKDLHSLTPPRSLPALEADALPLRKGCTLRAGLCDGEDYELVFAVSSKADPAVFERAWRRAFPRTRLSRIGRFLKPVDFPASALHLEDYRGFEHLRSTNRDLSSQK